MSWERLLSTVNVEQLQCIYFIRVGMYADLEKGSQLAMAKT